MDVTSFHASDHLALPPQHQPVSTPTNARTLKFQNSDEANAWLHSVTMLPPINPQADPTINIIAANRHTWVLAMIDAIYDLTACFDNPKMLAHFQPSSPSYISELEVEAACHILFDILISYCRYGYRALPKTNVHAVRLNSGKKNFPEDKAADCLTRMGNVITALRSWKSVCKGVVEEDTKKWQLVNAPVGVVGKKESERRCNVTKKKAADEGKKAKVELVKVKQVKQVTASHPSGSMAGHQHQVPHGGEAPRMANVGSNALPIPQQHGTVVADDAGKWIQEYPQHANATTMQAHEPWTPQYQGPVGAGDAGKCIQEYPQYANTTNMQSPARQAPPASSYPHTPESFMAIYANPHTQVYGLQPVSHQHNWPQSSFHWPQGDLDGVPTGPVEPLDIDDQDEDFWQGLGEFEDTSYAHNSDDQHGGFDLGQQYIEQPTSLNLLAQAAVQADEFAPWNAGQYQNPAPAVLYTEPASATDDTEPYDLAGKQDDLPGAVEASLTSDDAVHDEVAHLMQPPQAAAPPHGVKRGRKTSDLVGDVPVARRQKLD